MGKATCCANFPPPARRHGLKFGLYLSPWDRSHPHYGTGAGCAAQRYPTNGAHWIPAECDVSIRPGWFYHAEEDEQVKTPEQLWAVYLHSVGRGANLILNVPPDRRGRIHGRDSASLVGFGQKMQGAFAKNLAKGGKIGTPFRSRLLAPQKYHSYLLDGDRATFDSLPKEVSYLEIDLGKKKTFHTILLREAIAQGQRVQACQDVPLISEVEVYKM